MKLRGTRPWQPLATGAVVEGAGLAVAGGAGLLLPGPIVAAAVGYLGGAALILSRWRGSGSDRPRGRLRQFGIANLVTLGRVVGTCWVIGLTSQAVLGRLSQTGLLLMIMVGSCCLVLDGVDGRIARARGETTQFGARFDVETDAALNLALSLAVAVLGIAGWWVLAIGLLRYAYVAASLAAPRSVRDVLAMPLPDRYSGKVIAVIQGVALLIALALGLTGVAAAAPLLPTVILGAALALLCWSFARDIAGQFRASRG